MFRPRVYLKRTAVLFKPLKKFIGDLDIDIALATAIVSTGPASAYALVWEYGNIRQTKKGPKTTLGIDVDSGARVWLTIQAPKGYVRVLRPRFRTVIYQELGKVTFGKKNTKTQLVDALDRIGERLTKLVKEMVPVDSGALKQSITWLRPKAAKTLEQVLSGMKGNG